MNPRGPGLAHSARHRALVLLLGVVLGGAGLVLFQRSLGFLFEPGHDLPVGMSRRRQLGIDRVFLNCAVCHSGWNFTDEAFHDIGVKTADMGRGKLVDDVVEMLGAERLDNRGELILGGQKSGKSRRAEEQARGWLQADNRHEAVLIATAWPWDDEMRERIARHQRDRAVEGARRPRCAGRGS